MADVVTGNVYDKYRTGNPIFRRLMQGFLASARELLAGVTPTRILEVGCGPGDLAANLVEGLWPDVPYTGLDIGLDQVLLAHEVLPRRAFLPASAYALPMPDAAFDCVLACEVFEHLDDPRTALAEVRRVCAGHLLLSVPWEPVWRMLNVARLSYLSDLGNTPGHLQHYSRRAIRDLVASRFEIVAERHPFPWTMLLARIR